MWSESIFLCSSILLPCALAKSIQWVLKTPAPLKSSLQLSTASESPSAKAHAIISLVTPKAKALKWLSQSLNSSYFCLQGALNPPGPSSAGLLAFFFAASSFPEAARISTVPFPFTFFANAALGARTAKPNIKIVASGTNFKVKFNRNMINS